MAISRASMQQQLKGNKMKKKSKKVTPPKSLRESFNMAFQKNKNNKNTSSAAGKPVTMFKRRADAIKQTIEENPRAVKRLAEQNRKRKAQEKNIGGIISLCLLLAYAPQG